MSASPKRDEADRSSYRALQQQVGIEGLQVYCIIGLDPHERRQRQPLHVSLRWRPPHALAEAAAEDDLARTVNYAVVAREVRQFVHRGRYRLIETLAHRLGEHLCRRFELEQLDLEIRKPQAVRDSEGAVVRLVLQRAADDLPS